MAKRIVAFLAILLFLIAPSLVCAEYRESLDVQPLPAAGTGTGDHGGDHKTRVARLHWRFVQQAAKNHHEDDHDGLPQAIRRLLEDFPAVRALNWTLTQGRWPRLGGTAHAGWAPAGLLVSAQWRSVDADIGCVRFVHNRDGFHAC